jgi:hypothetical protein
MRRDLYSRKAFTLIELLVVIGIIMGILAMGTLAMGDFFSQGNFNLGVRSVVNGIRAARQHAVGNRVWVCLELVDTLNDGDTDNDLLPDYLAIWEAAPEAEDETGRMHWIYDTAINPMEKVPLPRNVGLILDTMGPAPGDIGGPASNPSRGLEGKKGFEFYPSGSSRPLDDATNVVLVRDQITWDEGRVYLYTVTSFVKVRIQYHWED